MRINWFLRAILIICAIHLIGGFLTATSWECFDLRFFINGVADEFGITPIIIDPNIRGTVDVSISTPLAKEDAFSLFLIVLKNNNAALIKDKKTYAVLSMPGAFPGQFPEIIDKLPKPSTPKSEPKQSPANTDNQKQPGFFKGFLMSPMAQGRDGRTAETPAASSKHLTNSSNQRPLLATHIVQVQFVPVKDVIESIKPFMTQGGVISPFERANILILTDYADNWARIRQTIQTMGSNPKAQDSHIGN